MNVISQRRHAIDGGAVAEADLFHHSAGPDLESILATYARPVESVLTLRYGSRLRID
jgi:hypothetical protein